MENKIVELIKNSRGKLVDFIYQTQKNYFETENQIDIYAYINVDGTDYELDVYENIGSSWLDDGHITLYSFEGHEFVDEFQDFRDFLEFMKDYGVTIPVEMLDECSQGEIVEFIRSEYGAQYEDAIGDFMDEHGVYYEVGRIVDEIIENLA